MKRDDLIHPIISGNKWRKLKHLLADAKSKGCHSLVSMGGNYSNHLHALAFAGKELDLKTIGLVRAHPEQVLTPTLQDCINWSMQLHFQSRDDYALLRQNLEWDCFRAIYPDSYWIAEGGYSELAIQGVSEIASEVKADYDYIFCGVGSGATLIGLAQAFPHSQVIGVAAFKGADYLIPELESRLKGFSNWLLATDYHYGGFAKVNDELLVLAKEFYLHNDFELDKVYNLKVLSCIIDQLKQSKIKAGKKLLMINTGGIQGNR